MIRLLPYDAVRPSTYNPRSADDARLELVGLSLRKLGFVLPLVADRDGELISGHQRHLVAGRLGFAEVPVMTIDAKDEADRKALNIVFNRGTNDMRVTDHSAGMSRQLAAQRVADLADTLPDTRTPFRCLTAPARDLAAFAATCRARYDNHMRNMARVLHIRAGILMPIVATDSGRVVNGVGRVQYGMESGNRGWPVVMISDAEADFAEAMLNLLSMDFDIHTRYADVLRHNSFRRSRTTRRNLGTGFTFALPKPPKKTAEFDIGNRQSADLWKLTYGSSVVDFGAGHLHETDMLRAAGVRVSPFEPYRCGPKDEIDRAASVDLNRAFLRDVADGVRFSSVFVSSVFNSVPFREDREKIVTICSALCVGGGVFYGNAMSVAHDNLASVTGSGGFSERRQDQATFALDYEGGIVLGDYMVKPKVQKFHTGQEFYDLLKTGFGVVQVKQLQGWLLCGIGVDPHPIDRKRLAAALAFEFDLPYPDGSRMGLSAEARAAFSKRLGVKL